MKPSLVQIIDSYNPKAPLEEALTIPAQWYTDQNLYNLELQTVFNNSWQLAGRVDQLREPGQYVTSEIAGEPIVVVRGTDGMLRGFFNACRHHAAAVMTEPEGQANQLRCPYHGWTYSLAGELKGTPDFSGVCNFDRAANGLLPVQTSVWENWVFVRVESGATSGPLSNNEQSELESFLGADLINQIRPLGIEKLHWMERRHYEFDCNWKVFVDNFLDGGYHVPYLHKGLDSVLDYSNYTIENGQRFCLQSSPIVSDGAEPETGAVRKGDRALYYWIYPNFMINLYDGVMDTNLVIPLGVDKSEVIFDFYFPDVSESARERNRASIEVGQRIQDEDVSICKSVQRGLSSRAYNAGRLSVRREAGEHLFHRLLHADLQSGLRSTADEGFIKSR
ncbi:MAG: aromatic ring-hydroxylating dioxygenase subunit alpha [Pyrinomonadaceae bacterium]|nr:aromatic ring-hydroxylating dioxygenase subunit alpha [Pyrinomonadaceae bacterium]